ncbi:MAG: sulfatase-like hydrolase/transferase [Bacteroidota bacterium]
MKISFSTSILFLCLGFLTFLSSCEAPSTPAADRPPNVVLMFIDDGAYDDYSPFGRPLYPTPHVEQLAAEGTSFTKFYVPQSVCSASRAALLSACYPGRTGVFGAHGPFGAGLDTAYATLGEVMQSAGYATASFGKWHIGDLPHTRPDARGFTESSGLMYSNDMWLHHPENPVYWGQHPLQYWKNGEVEIEEVTKDDQRNLTTWYTEDAVDFINRRKEEPFFLYVAHSMPHVPLFVSDKFEGKSGTGLYGDVMMEIDWSVGQINQALKDNGLEENTLFIFIGSDNGPWLSYSDHAGITPFREGKGTTFDGGVRNPCIIKYPSIIKPGIFSSNTFSSLDVLPTITQVTGAPLPDNPIDGQNVWPLIVNEAGATNPNTYYPLSNGRRFEGVISADGQWKLHLPHNYRTLDSGGRDGFPGKYRQDKIDTALFDLVHDPIEKGNVIDVYPEVAADLIELADAHYQRFYAPRETE